jgi:uncharacterized protein involved in outer membrane biogenesis
MKKIKSILVFVLIGLVVLVLVVAVVIGANLGRIVKAGIETVGPKITQTPITVDSVGLSLLSGSASVNGLVVGNPTGYQSTNAIDMDKASVSIAPGSLLSDKIVIKSVEVRAPQITFEGNPFGANNLSQLLDNVKGAPTTNEVVPASQTASGTAKPAKKLEVDDFLIAGAKVHVQLTGIINKSLDLTLPDIHLTDLGKGTDGITAAELTQVVLKEVISATIKSVGEAAGSITNVSGKTLNGTVDKIKTGLGGIFGK